MAFQTEVHSKLTINGENYSIGEHPYAPGVPYGQEGRQGTVYLLHTEDNRKKMALKVFRSKLINPSTVHLSSQIGKFSVMNGLAACERMTITPHNNPELLSREPDLLYAVVMPWIDGPTWMDIVLDKRQLTRRQSYTAAFALAEVLVTMEQRGLAHCDLSGPNLIMPMFSEGRNPVKSSDFVQLIDLEQMFSNQFERPEHVPVGSPGYAPKYANSQMWNAQSDRFSGAILLAEMLVSCTDIFVEHAWGESYFDPDELQTFCRRYDYMQQAVKSLWGESIAALVQRTWESDELSQCPTFGEWMLELSKVDQAVLREDMPDSTNQSLPPAAVPKEQKMTAASARRETAAAQSSQEHAVPGMLAKQPDLKDQARFSRLMQNAKEYENKGNKVKAIGVYREILALNPHAGVAKEIEIAIEHLQKQSVERKNNKRKIEYGVLAKKLFKLGCIIVLLAAIAVGGYYLFQYFKGLADAGPVATKQETKAANDELDRLKQEIAAREQTIADLSEEIEELRKPLSQRSEELVQKLNAAYEEIKYLSELDVDAEPELHQKVFEATEVYMKHVREYYKNAYSLDEGTLHNIDVVEGYYFPFIYNHNRNAQLNYKFLTDYRENF